MMRRENGRVVIELSEKEAVFLNHTLGVFYAHLRRIGNDTGALKCLRLANSINEGNPDWTPYAVDGDGCEKPTPRP